MSEISQPSPPPSPPPLSLSSGTLVSEFSTFSLEGTAQSNKQSIDQELDNLEVRIINAIKEKSSSIRNSVNNLYTVSTQSAIHSSENDRLLRINGNLRAESETLQKKIRSSKGKMLNCRKKSTCFRTRSTLETQKSKNKINTCN